MSIFRHAFYLTMPQATYLDQLNERVILYAKKYSLVLLSSLAFLIIAGALSMDFTPQAMARFAAPDGGCWCTTYVANYYHLPPNYPNADRWGGWLRRQEWRRDQAYPGLRCALDQSSRTITSSIKIQDVLTLNLCECDKVTQAADTEKTVVLRESCPSSLLPFLSHRPIRTLQSRPLAHA